mmetsp:Transcript_122054/g.243065  ORF Transcript_122054/g.243065 Transcript_122054/m.243065 type:complete len:200 (+) Transcript_122054:256-855(+)
MLAAFCVEPVSPGGTKLVPMPAPGAMNGGSEAGSRGGTTATDLAWSPPITCGLGPPGHPPIIPLFGIGHLPWPAIPPSIPISPLFGIELLHWPGIPPSAPGIEPLHWPGILPSAPAQPKGEPPIPAGMPGSARAGLPIPAQSPPQGPLGSPTPACRRPRRLPGPVAPGSMFWSIGGRDIWLFFLSSSILATRSPLANSR